MKKLLLMCSVLCTLLNVGCEQLKNDEQNIVFKDQLVKQICVENWDTNSDGELSYSEAASVVTVNEIFIGTNIVSFDELQYFTGLTKLEPCTFSCEHLNNIIIPDNVTLIEQEVFCDSYSLKDVTIGKSVQTIEHAVFAWNYILENVYCKPITPPTISAQQNFEDFNESLFTIYVPTQSVEAYKKHEDWSRYAKYIKGYNFDEEDSSNNQEDDINKDNGFLELKCAPNEIIYKTQYNTPVAISDKARFYGHNLVSNTYENGIGRLTFDADITSMGALFYNCKSLTHVILPEGFKVTNYVYADDTYYGMFGSCTNLNTVIFPSTLVSLDGYTFNSCHKLQYIYCKSTTPPDYSIYCGLRYYDSNTEEYIYQDCTIFVPIESVNVYKSAEHWRYHNIKGYNFN